MNTNTHTSTTPALRYNGIIPMHSPRALNVGQIAEVLTEGGEYWLDVYAPDFKTAQQRAAFIVRACNSHAALVEALGMCIRHMDGLALDLASVDPTWLKPGTVEALDGTIDTARAALAAAKGGAK